jgi:hypothetical protein
VCVLFIQMSHWQRSSAAVCETFWTYKSLCIRLQNQHHKKPWLWLRISVGVAQSSCWRNEGDTIQLIVLDYEVECCTGVSCTQQERTRTTLQHPGSTSDSFLHAFQPLWSV